MKKLLLFEEHINAIDLPDKLNDPFSNVVPHLLCQIAAKQVQDFLSSQTDLKHNFGVGAASTEKAIGKMFGILVVKTQDGVIGFLAAFSGKLANKNHHARFVPPVFDSLEENGFLNQGMLRLESINKQVRDIKTAGCRATVQLIQLQQQRRALSQSLQHQLFESYHFLNTKGETKSPYALFGNTPPAGAGECAAPKLFQYAYLHQLKPLAIAEFWWGVPPTLGAASRRHGHYYPACEQKCRCVLGWMLS